MPAASHEAAKTNAQISASKGQKPEQAKHHENVANPLWAQLATQTVATRLQAKLSVGRPDDHYEREAEHVADRVMAVHSTGVKPSKPSIVSRLAVGTAQRQEADTDTEQESEEQDTSVQAKAIGDGAQVPTIQRVCTECQEKLQRKTSEEEDAPGLQTKPLWAAPPIQRQADDEGESDAENEAELPTMQAKAKSDGGSVSSSVEGKIGALRGSGQPLDASTRSFMEPRFDRDLGGVRVHTDTRAAGLASEVQAKAFTTGNNVVFGAGQYAPNTNEGKHLLAHELTHTVQQGAVGDSSPDVQRKPPDLPVGDGYMVKTPQVGKLMLRVKPTPSQYLDTGKKSPNTKGNIRSGTPVTIKKVLSYDWYVVEVATIEHGPRIGFVNEKYLKPAQSNTADIEGTYASESQTCDISDNVCLPDDTDTPAPAPVPDVVYEDENQVCLEDENQCYLPPTPDSDSASDPSLPEQDTTAASFEMSNAEFDALEDGAAIEQMGVVATDDGTNLWPQADRAKPKLGLLPTNTRVFVERKVGAGWYEVYVEGHQHEGRPTAPALPVSKGTHGYVAASRINTQLPDPNAWLFRITKAGQGALSVAGEVYKDNFSASWGKDYRFLVNVLVGVNKVHNRNFLYKEKASDGWEDAKTLKGGQIWVPGIELVNAMHGQVSSGSISYEVLSTIGNVLIGIAAFIVGLLHGALMSVLDVFIGIYDLLKIAKDIVVKLFNQTLIKDAKAFWKEISQIKYSDIAKLVDSKWNHPDIWTRWKFRGYVTGYAIVEILMLYFSAGIITAIKWAGKAGKLGKISSYLAKLPQVQKLVTAAGTLKGKGVAKMKAALKAANALSKSHGWAAKAMRIPLHILRRLSEVDIGKLKKLPQWAQERFSRLKSEAMLRLLGCHSPCKVDRHAIEQALKLATKAGTKLNSPQDVLNVLKKLDPKFKVSKISRKLRKSDSALMKVIKEAGITDTDFAKLADFLTPGDLANQAQAYRTFVRYLTNMVPAKTGNDITEFNRIMAAMIKAEPRRGAALKGAMFENWIALHVPRLAGKSFNRITFNLRKLLGKTKPPFRRPVDMWTGASGEIWEMKHTFRKVPIDQAKDFAELVAKKAMASDGNVVQKVMYIFPSEDVAKLNRHLADTFKFGVYYIDDATNDLVKFL